MPPQPEDLQFIVDRINTIEGTYVYNEPAVQDKKELTSPLVIDHPKSIIDNTAYHDYYRIELVTPEITTELVDFEITRDLGKIVNITSTIPQLFSASVTAATPTDADDVEALVVDVSADLDALSAGPIPPLVRAFISEGLADSLDQATWSALSIAQREWLIQLALAWRALVSPTVATTSSHTTQTTYGRSPSITERAVEYLNPVTSPAAPWNW
jgi:hypothetical protein